MIWSYSHLLRIDLRIVPLLLALLLVSLVTIAAYTTDGSPDALEGSFLHLLSIIKSRESPLALRSSFFLQALIIISSENGLGCFIF